MPTRPPRLNAAKTNWRDKQSSSGIRIRGRAHQVIRQEHLTREPACRECLKLGKMVAADQVDHIIPLFLGGKESPENRQSLCLTHHAEKSARERGHTLKSKKTIGFDGWLLD